MKRRDFLHLAMTTPLMNTLPAFAEAPSSNNIPPALTAYAQQKSLQMVALSPDANTIAYIGYEDDETILVFYSLKTESFSQIKVGNVIPRMIRFAGPDHLLIKTAIAHQDLAMPDFQDKEFTVLSLLNIRTKKLQGLLVSTDNVLSSFRDPIYIIKRDGNYYVTAAAWYFQMHAGMGIYQLFSIFCEFDVNTGKMRQLDSTDDFALFTNWAVDNQGQIVARSNIYEKRWQLQFHQNETWKTVYELDENLEYPDIYGLGRDGNSVLVRFESGELKNNYVEIDHEGKLSAPIEEGYGSDRPLFHPLTNRLIGFMHGNDWPKPIYTDPAFKKIYDGAISAAETDFILISDTAEDPRKIILYSAKQDEAGDYSYIDFSTGQSNFIGSIYPEVPTQWIGKKQKINFKASDGLELEAYLTLPPMREARALPLIVYPHGGPASHDEFGFEWEPQAYASRGYAVLQVNFRGSDGYSNEFLKAGYGEWGRKMQTDLSDGVRYLVNKGIIDAKRVAIVGASYGGYAALAGATLDTGVYRCAVSVAGVSDLQALLDHYTRLYHADNQLERLDRRQWGAVDYASISPAKQADKADIPILLIHGKNDTVVPISQSRIMYHALKSAGKDVDLIEFDKEDHWQSLPSARLEMIEAIIAFLGKHNPAFI